MPPAAPLRREPRQAAVTTAADEVRGPAGRAGYTARSSEDQRAHFEGLGSPSLCANFDSRRGTWGAIGSASRSSADPNRATAASRPTQQGADAPSGASGLLLAKKQESPPALLVVVHSSDVRRVPDSARSPGHLTGRVLRDTRRRLLRERCPYAGEVPARGSAHGTAAGCPVDYLVEVGTQSLPPACRGVCVGSGAWASRRVDCGHARVAR
jgi:hypothetical protein